MDKISPFIKWVGGKRQLKKEIIKRMPKKFNNFYEPFVGGGALFIELQNKKTVISDINSELIEAYKTIRDNPIQLMNLLDIFTKEHNKNPKEYFYSKRDMDKDCNWNDIDAVTKSARLIYLNKTCFNGMYRLNNNGYFNVPFNQKKEVNLYNKNNILLLSEFLNKNVEIHNLDFEDVCKKAQPNDFIFFDPPYDLLNKNTFEKYNKETFGTEGQKRLAKIAHELKVKGCFVMITNHNTELINDLYSDFHIDVLNVRRSINSKGNKRTGVETIIYSYEV